MLMFSRTACGVEKSTATSAPLSLRAVALLPYSGDFTGILPDEVMIDSANQLRLLVVNYGFHHFPAHAAYGARYEYFNAHVICVCLSLDSNKCARQFTQCKADWKTRDARRY
jgi:hypothetical protein